MLSINQRIKYSVIALIELILYSVIVIGNEGMPTLVAVFNVSSYVLTKATLSAKCSSVLLQCGLFAWVLLTYIVSIVYKSRSQVL